jgi:hypothetical protein
MRTSILHSGWLLFAVACSGGGSTASSSTGGPTDDAGADSAGFIDASPPPVFEGGPPAGNPTGRCQVPVAAALIDTQKATTVVGNGTAASCTADAFVAAVAKGGIITFACGPDPVTITLNNTAKVFNNTGPDVVIDGGGKVTLSGGGKVRILYMNTCDEKQVFTSSHCQDQDTPKLTVQNITMIDGNARGANIEGSGGAIFARGGEFKVINSRFFRNTADMTGPDVGGGAIRRFSPFAGRPSYIVQSTFGGSAALANTASNGGAISSIGVSYTIVNSLLSFNSAAGNGANPAKPNTPGGGSGGAIYNDGNTFTLDICGTKIEDNTANEGGGAIFFVSNDRSGSLRITDSAFARNPSKGFETKGFPGIFVLAKANPQVTNSTIE